MLLRPFQPPAAEHRGFVPAWDVVERLQLQTYDRCWMITQPSHAALAGEIAAKLTGPHIPKLDDELVRAIALHDAGWGPVDAQAVVRSRAARPPAPKSFLNLEAADVLDAWTQSIQVAQAVGAAGGFIVSRHFHRIAGRRLADAGDSAGDRKKLEKFIAHETQRQTRLAARQRRRPEELETLTDLLQLCDLFSLYVCCGALENVELPDCCGVKLRLWPENDGYKLDPQAIAAGTRFAVAALRFPATREKSGQELPVSIL